MSSLSSAAPARPAEHSATPGPAAGVENRPANTTATLLPRPYVPERVTEPFTSAARESFSAMIEATGDNTRHISALQYYELRQWLTGRPTRTNVDRRARRHAKDNYTFYEGEGGKEGLYKKAGEGYEERKVLRKSEVFDAIQDAHLDTGHTAIESTYKHVVSQHYGVTRNDVAFLLPLCQVCIRTRNHPTAPARITPILSKEIFERLQVDLVDYSNHPDPVTGDKYVLHIRDHYSKFSQLVPLQNKTARAVASGILRWIQAFGAPKMLHCDNGTEFKGAVRVLMEDYRIKITLGAPYHPESQGGVERGNRDIKTKLAKACTAWGHPGFAHACVDVTLQSNATPRRNIGMSAHKVLFGRNIRIGRVRRPLHERAESPVIVEDNITESSGDDSTTADMEVEDSDDADTAEHERGRTRGRANEAGDGSQTSAGPRANERANEQPAERAAGAAEVVAGPIGDPSGTRSSNLSPRPSQISPSEEDPYHSSSSSDLPLPSTLMRPRVRTTTVETIDLTHDTPPRAAPRVSQQPPPQSPLPPRPSQSPYTSLIRWPLPLTPRAARISPPSAEQELLRRPDAPESVRRGMERLAWAQREAFAAKQIKEERLQETAERALQLQAEQAEKAEQALQALRALQAERAERVERAEQPPEQHPAEHPPHAEHAASEPPLAQHAASKQPAPTDRGWDRSATDATVRRLGDNERQRMVKQSNTSQAMPPFTIGSVVGAKVPEADQRGAPQMLIGVIHEVIGQMYSVRTPFGVLNRPFPPHKLALLQPAQRPDHLDTPEANQRISVRQATQQNGLSLGMIAPSCQCTRGCNNNRCVCRKEGRECGIRCHGGSQCSNPPQQGESSIGAAGEAAGRAVRGVARGGRSGRSGRSGRGGRGGRGGRSGRGGGSSTVAEAPATAEAPTTAEAPATVEGRGGRRGRGGRVRRGSGVARDGGTTRSGRVSRPTAHARGDD